MYLNEESYADVSTYSDLINPAGIGYMGPYEDFEEPNQNPYFLQVLRFPLPIKLTATK
jgi:hypothetical protein